MSVDTDFAAFEAEIDTPPAAPETPPTPPAPSFSIDDLAPMDTDDLPTPDPEKEELRRRVQEFESRPAPSPFDAPRPEPPMDPRERLKNEFKKKLESGDPDAAVDAFVLAAEAGAAAAEARMRDRFAAASKSMVESTVDKFVRKQQESNPQLWKAVQKDFDGFMDDARKRLAANPGSAERLNEQLVQEACEDFFERSKGRALDRYMAKSTAAKRAPAAPPTSAPSTPPPDYNPMSGPDNGKSGPLVGKDKREERIIRDGRTAGLTDDEIRDLL